MHCVTCGTSLPPEVDTCPNCHAATPYNHRKVSNPPIQEKTQRAEDVPQQDFEPTLQNTFPGQSIPASNRPEPTQLAQAQESLDASEPTVAVPQNYNDFEQANRYQENPQSSAFSEEATEAVPPPPAYPDYKPAESPYAYHSAPATSNQAPYSYSPYNYSAQPAQQKRKPRSPLMIALVLVVILLIISAAGLLGYAQILRPIQIRANATATAQTIATNEAHASATADARATATENAQLTATAVANVTATAQAQATAAANQAVLTQATSGAPTIDESLAQNSNSNWAEGTATDGSCQFTGGAYHINIHTTNVFLPCFATNTGFTNFAMQVNMTIVSGNEGGLIIRADPNANHFYIFRITSDGTFDLAKFVDNTGKNTVVLSDGVDSSIHTGTGKTNTISIVARNNKMYLYVNKHFLGSASDGAYTSGQLGLFAGDSKVATEASFQNLQVWTL